MQDIRDLEPKCGDAARRMASEVILHAMAGSAGQWCAIRLSDGGGDKTTYPSRAEALSHQLSPERCTYILIPPDGMTTGQADRVLDYWRQLYDAGFRAIDARDDIPSMPLTRPEGQRQIRLLTKTR